MRKFLMIALAGAALILMLLSACSPVEKVFTEPDRVANIALNQVFFIALGSNITTGYSWQTAFDSRVLRLVEKTYKERDNTSKQIVSASGTEFFKFQALDRGKTRVTFTYRRSWEQPSAQDRTLAFTVDVR